MLPMKIINRIMTKTIAFFCETILMLYMVISYSQHTNICYKTGRFRPVQKKL